MSIIKCPNELSCPKSDWKVFLMGPIQGAPEWQFTLPELDGVTYFSPRRESYPVPNFNYTEQVDWETTAINMADILFVWIPEEAEHIEGRDYAQTTRFEVGENLAKGKKMIIGIHNNFAGRKYFQYKAERYKNVVGNTVYSTFEECIEALKKCTSTVKFDFSEVDEATMKMRLNSRGYKMSYLNSISYDKLKELYDYCESHMI